MVERELCIASHLMLNMRHDGLCIQLSGLLAGTPARERSENQGYSPSIALTWNQGSSALIVRGKANYIVICATISPRCEGQAPQ